MKKLKSTLGRLIALCGIAGAAFVFTGCQSQPQYADFPLTNSSATAKPNSNGTYTYQQPKGKSETFRVGDLVRLNYASVNENAPLQPYSETIKDDGRINAPIVGSVVAAGKSPGALQAELQEKYNKY